MDKVSALFYVPAASILGGRGRNGRRYFLNRGWIGLKVGEGLSPRRTAISSRTVTPFVQPVAYSVY
jgi:hypothetical protein